MQKKFFKLCLIFSIFGLQSNSTTMDWPQDPFQAIEHSLKNDNLEAIKEFIDKPNHPVEDVMGWTLLHRAVDANAYNIAEYLVRLVTTDSNNQEPTRLATPLHLAIEKGRTSIARMLIRHGVDQTIPNRDQETPLHRAVFTENIAIIQLLAANPYSRASLLNLAVNRNNTAIVLLLLKMGLDISVKNVKGKTALQMALDDNKHEIAKTIQTFTLLKDQFFNAIAHDNYVQVKELLQHIPIRFIKDKNGRSPLECAIHNNAFTSAQLLLSIDPSSITKEAVYEAALKGPYSLKTFFNRKLSEKYC
jgi:uncharacterized protein